MSIRKLLVSIVLTMAVFGFIVGQAQGGSAPPQDLVATGDINGDGDTDIILEANSGLLFGWLMSTNTVDTAMGIATPPTGFELVAIGKANDDNNDDIFLQDLSGANTIFVWLMNGTAIDQSLFVGIPPAGFTVIAAADLDGDMDADLILQDGSGLLFVWFLEVSGSTVNVVSEGIATPPAGFSVVATGNFDANDVNSPCQACDDVLLQDAGSGLLNIWFMNGSAIVASEGVATPPAGFEFRTVGDYNGDGDTDITLQNGSDGVVFQWLMTGSTISASGGVATPPAGILLFGSGNFDGKSQNPSSTSDDYILQDSPQTPGAIFEWLMTATTIDDSLGVAAPPAGFMLINP